jgi:hypothetical protein
MDINLIVILAGVIQLLFGIYLHGGKEFFKFFSYID